MLKKTEWKPFVEHGQKHRIQATYGIDYDFAVRNRQAPYFSITMTRDRQAENGRWMDDGGGAAHEEIARRFHNLAPYIKWHLVSTDGPMHYFANAKYWWEIATGRLAPDKYQRIDPWDAFRSTVVFGGLPNDGVTMPPANAPWSAFHNWMTLRLPALKETFKHAMKTLGVWEGS